MFQFGSLRNRIKFLKSQPKYRPRSPLPQTDQQESKLPQTHSEIRDAGCPGLSPLSWPGWSVLISLHPVPAAIKRVASHKAQERPFNKNKHYPLSLSRLEEGYEDDFQHSLLISQTRVSRICKLTFWAPEPLHK